MLYSYSSLSQMILSYHFCYILLTSLSSPNSPPSTFNECRRSQPEKALRARTQSTIPEMCLVLCPQLPEGALVPYVLLNEPA